MKSNIRVYIRVKPGEDDGLVAIRVNKQNLELVNNLDGQELQLGKFKFDYCFNKETTQKEVFDMTSIEVLNQVIKGYNSTIIAYG
jgi:hypothetical protein